ncbi:ATP-dependent DNA helicase [Pseudonocardia asaccharolytica]|uniref:ATP-dependent helicase DinG n=1 Tax=Pseudonocardia asaccharolytica DSM 44247 = NBRC 16224 TaxID=1123024 RepID=A0A511D1W4_9PSEU|nr:ATP-dependent DNA helicase [Pseudonocardia asaccharolytica]GEL18677.1 ATP-dependent DNA helicase DinG [Pseudonocardia asaccharolytica DSM 44247 = NBRC 16224]
MPAALPSTREVPGVAELLEAAVGAVGGTRREGQDAMAAAVRAAITRGEHLAVQAGTGTGKSLAYLVPSIRHAVTNDATVVVSTATIALQRQLVDRDLPRLAEALRPLLGRPPTFAILKGRRNYLCLNRLHGDESMIDPAEELFDPFAISAMGRNVKRLHEWASDTETGDRDELVPGVPDAAWRQVSVSARECLGVSRCPIGDDCFAEKARAAAGRADIVVTNHALLAIDALEDRPVLPDHDVVVVDEAHELVARVTGVATAELTAGTVAAAARRCTKLVDQAVVDRLVEAGEGLAMVLEDLPPARWDTLPTAAAGALSVIRDTAAACRQGLGGDRREDPDGAGSRKVAQALLDEVTEVAVRILGAFDEPGPAQRHDVVWVGEQGSEGARTKVLRAAPLWVGGLLRERLFGQRTVILTSATLALGGTFDALARQWGLPPTQLPPSKAAAAGWVGEVADDPVPDPDAPKWRGLDVGSPFSHARSGILYLARHLPPPGRDGLAPAYLDEIAGLVEAAGGRTLGLFSSMRAAKQAAEALRGRLGTPLLCQGDDSTMLLVRQFAKDPGTSLFGTLSLWQGVDVPGPSLSCVIIDRIPFPRPDDPLISARQRAADARGGNGFLTVSATHAALLLAQGAGRLLRGMDDRGVVAILDPRLVTARYGGFLRASLPPFWTTNDPQKVRGALRRLRGG